MKYSVYGRTPDGGMSLIQDDLEEAEAVTVADEYHARTGLFAGIVKQEEYHRDEGTVRRADAGRSAGV